MLGEIEKQVRWHFISVGVPRRPDAWSEHEAIVEAIENHDEARAGELISEHNRHTVRSYVDALVDGRVLPAGEIIDHAHARRR
jgi:DNA-binding GntR family transcriptional regulator